MKKIIKSQRKRCSKKVCRMKHLMKETISYSLPPVKTIVKELIFKVETRQ